jgi:hypothetical protein
VVQLFSVDSGRNDKRARQPERARRARTGAAGASVPVTLGPETIAATKPGEIERSLERRARPLASLTASWGVSFDHLTGGGIDDLSSFSRLGGGTYSPLSVG